MGTTRGWSSSPSLRLVVLGVRAPFFCGGTAQEVDDVVEDDAEQRRPAYAVEKDRASWGHGLGDSIEDG